MAVEFFTEGLCEDSAFFQVALGLCALATALPLFMAEYLPLVDLSQHLHLINVWAHLNDASTLYPEIFKARGEITPYEGTYLVVRVLAAVLPILTANRLFLALVAVATVLSVLALCKALGRSPWLCLLAGPFFYGDNLYWGFINYCAALPLLFFSMALSSPSSSAKPPGAQSARWGWGCFSSPFS